MSAIRHLYVHLPFCVHRCGYCDFVTAVGKREEHAPYVDALIAELATERHLLADDVDTVFVGGGTPTFTEPEALVRLLAALPSAREVTVEANPETVTPEIAQLLSGQGVNRVSLGAQTFQPRLLEVLERTATPDDVRRAVHTLRDASIDNISLDLLYGIPCQEPADLDADITEALALGPEHLSCYELEAKPGTRFTHGWGEKLTAQAEAMEEHFTTVVDRLTAAGYRWYETANFARLERENGEKDAATRDLRAHHNLAYWSARDYLGVGVGAVSTIPAPAETYPSTGSDGGGREAPLAASLDSGTISLRRRNLPGVARYVRSLSGGHPPAREIEHLDARTKAEERLMLGLRLDEPLSLAGLEEAIDDTGLRRMIDGGLAEAVTQAAGPAIRLTRRGRFLGGAVTASISRDRPDL
jgi:oxygen-independent coproporphyrinogen III oxidase